jgi:alpha-aminoadipate carrier protein LysW
MTPTTIAGETLSTQPCPGCAAPIVVDDSALPNEILECGECNSELEVIATGPTVLALAPEIEEDWGE